MMLFITIYFAMAVVVLMISVYSTMMIERESSMIYLSYCIAASVLWPIFLACVSFNYICYIRHFWMRKK